MVKSPLPTGLPRTLRPDLISRFSLPLLLVLVTGIPVSAADVPSPSAAEFTALSVEPAEIQLGGRNRQQQVRVTASREGSRPIDVTSRAEFRISAAATARITGSIVQGVANGEATLEVRAGGQMAQIPVRVSEFERFPPVHFDNDLIPLLTKAGCNSGGCHGKASGQNGFKLSVFGFDPGADHAALAKEGRGRRIFPADPERSLLVLKATGRVPHGGGRRIEAGTDDETLLVEWVRQGLPRGPADAPRVVGLRVSPAETLLTTGSDQQIVATAVFSDGGLRDVTAAAAYTSNAGTVADVLRLGKLQTGQTAGEAAITVNYLGQVAVVRIQVPRTDGPSPFPMLPVQNSIDPLVWNRLEKMGILSSELADDATFLRRLYLDTLGMLPEPREVRAFLADNSSDKRSRAIDEVLARPELADYWALKWADVLLVDRNRLGDRGAYEFHRWLRGNFAQNRPYDVWVRELITASGDSSRNGPVNFYRAQRTPEELVRGVSQAFLGIRMDCAQCHHHPFERWGQDDFYGLAGYFNGIERTPLAGAPTRELIYHAGYRETRHPLTAAIVPTRPPGGDIRLEADGDPRLALAEWLTAADNPWFARLLVNRLWKHFLGRGIVEPEDDLRTTNPATNEPLLQHLTEQAVAARFDVRALMRLILNSRVYQLSSVTNSTNADDEQNFSHYRVKRLPAEVLMDAISQVTGVPEEFPGLPLGTRAVELWDNRFPSYFLEIFGRPERNTPCECGRSNEPTLAQALHLMNAPELAGKISRDRGRLARLLSEKAGREAILEEICLAALGRLPNARERTVAEELFSQTEPADAAEDLLWTLLNSYDFLFVK